ncbi:sigma-54 interaction domain-containing protein [Bacillus massiliigorillae]|uniref:sigma-54 interaction domain-containing protein n=1 Tax=Bacillus massiliigorillae TaxID=1243664 RepID=UPI000693E899|nr:sigma 54-interacting transcriptional regulator [Bacillus massiliigorillae]
MNMKPMEQVKMLQKQVNDLETIFQCSQFEIFVTDGNGVCLKVNQVGVDNMGLPKSEIVGRNVRDLVNQGIFNPSATVQVIEEKKTVQIIQLMANGERRHITSTPVFDEDGELKLIISNSMDISEVLSLRDKMKEMERLVEIYNDRMATQRKTEVLYGSKIVAKSPVMIQIMELLTRVSKVNSTVLLLGESGVGKTEIAKWIHGESGRSEGKFVEINCGAIPASLFESELFGYEPGAFSGGLPTGKKGLIELAHKGTLFLDEIGELSLDLQVKLLQVIQSKSFMKIGGRTYKEVDIRIIAATNRDLKEMVENGDFRQDLYYRLAVVPIKVPPLRERRDELIELIFSLLDRINKKYGSMKVLAPHVLEELVEYDWPGNIRELENTLERLVVTTEGTLIDKALHVKHSNENRVVEAEQEVLQEEQKLYKNIIDHPNLSLEERLQLVEKEILSHYMNELGSTRKVAKILNSSQSTISRKCQKYNIKVRG